MGNETAIATSGATTESPASPYFRYVQKITQLSVQLADALSKNDELTKERDEAREEIRRLRRAQYNKVNDGANRAPTRSQGRRKSDPGRRDADRSDRRMLRGSDGSRSSFSSASSVRQLLLSNLQSEEASSPRSAVALRNLSQTRCASGTSSLGPRVSSNGSLKSLRTYDELNARFEKMLTPSSSNNQGKISLPILSRKTSDSNSTVSTASLSTSYTSGSATSPGPTPLRRGSSRSSTASSLSFLRMSTDMENYDDSSLLLEGEITWGKLKS